MAEFARRLSLALLTGYIFLYFGELVFWATPDREGMQVGPLIVTWMVYSVFGYVFLGVVSLFRVRNPWAVFLAGACFGWYEEGIFVQTTYGSPDTPFPMSISFTALAWHAWLDAFVGWYLVRRALAAGRLLHVIALALVIGLFFGYWSIFWWNEPPAAMHALLAANRTDVLLVRFAMYAFTATGILIVSYALFNRLASCSFQPSRVEWSLLGFVTIAYYALITVPNAPRALWVLPPLLGITLIALECNRRVETRIDVISRDCRPVGLHRYLALLLIPGTAVAICFVALALDARVHSNWVVYYVSTAFGAVMWLTSLAVLIFRGVMARSQP